MMKLLAVYICIILLLYVVGIVVRNKNEYSFLDKTHTNILKGIAILMVISAHVCVEVGISNVQFVAAAGVGVFLFCSGYGLMYSYMEDGLHNYFRKRFAKVIIPCWIADIVGHCMIRKAELSIFEILLLKKANWFIPHILVCYVLFWVIARFAKKKKRMYGLCLLFLLWYILGSTVICREDIPFLEPRQMAMFPLGVFVAHKKQNIEKCIKSLLSEKIGRCKVWIGIFCMILTGCIGQLALQVEAVDNMPYVVSNFGYLCVNSLLAIAVISITVIWKTLFQNGFIYKLGLISYEVFLVAPFIIVYFDSEIAIVKGMIVLGIGAVLLNLVDSNIMKVIKGRVR